MCLTQEAEVGVVSLGKSGFGLVENIGSRSSVATVMLIVLWNQQDDKNQKIDGEYSSNAKRSTHYVHSSENRENYL